MQITKQTLTFGAASSQTLPIGRDRRDDKNLCVVISNNGPGTVTGVVATKYPLGDKGFVDAAIGTALSTIGSGAAKGFEEKAVAYQRIDLAVTVGAAATVDVQWGWT